MNILLASMAAKLGARVVARSPVFYAQLGPRGIEIAAGSKGVVTSVTCAGALVDVKWDGRDDAMQTSSDSVDFFGEDVAS